MIVFANDACVIHASGAMILRRSVRRGEVLARLSSRSGKSLVVRAGDDGRAGEILVGSAAAVRAFLASR